MDQSDGSQSRARLVGINHVAIEVGDVDDALAFYGQVFRFELRGRSADAAFIDMGDQFIAIMKAGGRRRDQHRHFGLVVDDRSTVRERALAARATILEDGFLDFLDPWGNRIQVVNYRDIQFTKADHVLRGMGLTLAKSEKALAELQKKNMAP